MMRQNGIGRMVLLCLLLFLLASGCGGGTEQTPAPTPTPPSEPRAGFDIEPAVRKFLANVPNNYGLVLSQVVVKTKPFIVDVRQPEEYSKGFIEGAVNIPLRELVRNLQTLPTVDTEIVVVDSSGHRSAIGMAALQMLGYKQAKSLAGGMQAWQTAKLAVITQPIPKRPTGQTPKVDTDLQAALDHYLRNVLPADWGTIDSSALAEDQQRKSSQEIEIQPETYDQGPSILVDADEPDEFAKGSLPKAINIPFRELPDNLEKIPADKVTLWA